MEPLNLPRGSVRAVLTILVVLFAGLSLFIPLAPGAATARGMFVAAAAFILKDYFQTRQQQNAEDGPPVAPPKFRGE